MANLQATIGCAYLLYVCGPDTPPAYNPILHGRGPVALPCVKSAGTRSKTIGSAHDTRPRATGWAENQ